MVVLLPASANSGCQGPPYGIGPGTRVKPQAESRLSIRERSAPSGPWPTNGGRSAERAPQSWFVSLNMPGPFGSGRSVSAPGGQWFLAVPGRLGLGLGGRLQGEPLGSSAPSGDVPGGTAEIGLAALQQLQPDLA